MKLERLLDLPPAPGNPRNSEGSFLPLTDGRPLFVYSHFTQSMDDDAAAALCALTLDAQGVPGPPEEIIPSGEDGARSLMSLTLPRMENGAPARTDTSSGSEASPSFLPQRASRSASAATISSSAPSGQTLPAPEYSTQVWQVMVKPPGTGRPMRLISARLAPLPPSAKCMDLSPSVTQVPWASVPKR